MRTYICSKCGSTNVRRDADVAWNAQSQAWELAGVYDAAVCIDCGHNGNLAERLLAPDQVSPLLANAAQAWVNGEVADPSDELLHAVAALGLVRDFDPQGPEAGSLSEQQLALATELGIIRIKPKKQRRANPFA